MSHDREDEYLADDDGDPSEESGRGLGAGEGSSPAGLSDPDLRSNLFADIGDPLYCDVEDRVALVTLDRPGRRNALNTEMLEMLVDTFNELDEDDEVDVIVLTGSDPAFCSGIDLQALGDGELDFSTLPAEDEFRRGPLPARTKPLIGAINGPAITGGLELALHCDFLVASTKARFADTHVQVGVMPGWGLTALLPEAIGVRRARQMSLSGNFVDAVTALSWGLVNEVVSHEQVLSRSLEIAYDIAGHNQRAVQQMLTTYKHGAAGTLEAAWQVEAKAARAWGSATTKASDVLAVRDQVIERGRRQIIE